MTIRHLGIGSALALLAGAVLLTPTANAQQSARFRGMDANRDGVVSRAEWPGNDQSFRQHDSNRDGVLNGDEVRAANAGAGDYDGIGLVGDFGLVDLDGNGHVTSQEWRRAFTQLDDNRDGSLTQDDFASATTGRRWSRERSRPVAIAACSTGVEPGARTARGACGTSRDSGNWSRPTLAMPTNSARAISIRRAIARDSGRRTPKAMARVVERGAKGRRVHDGRMRYVSAIVLVALAVIAPASASLADFRGFNIFKKKKKKKKKKIKLSVFSWFYGRRVWRSGLLIPLGDPS